MSPARFTAKVRDPVWEAIYAPIAAGIDYASGRLDKLQFLSIRKYLGFVLAALVFLLLVLAIWP